MHNGLLVIDGLPHQSHQYRINQNGNKLFDIMNKAKEYLNTMPHYWQYIKFDYNKDNVEYPEELQCKTTWGSLK